MVFIVGHYYGTSFKGHQGFTQGIPISPAIFNMVVDAVIRHWFTLVTGKEEGPDVFGKALQWLEKSLYANNRLITSPRLYHLHVDLGVLTGGF